ncbi:dienelactone hydrolase family protein [Paenibacillus sp. 481]|uniref:dienelactone hydrolase family protein n=1 Tax=Paenibacillus sp. 481 TaxID=2835869 RepID=UPI001E4F7C3B|nr:dienelactone hydrolase family protein [Paenibacillus sp. 481]UHA71928.1 dienelactone hydrolase family protein [Paenibacillus sp. 481]
MNRQSSAKSLTIVLHEIYGVNDHIHFFRDIMMQEGFDVLTPNLLHVAPFPYEQESEAYLFFRNEVGFQKSLLEVKHIVKENREKYDRIYIIGFSVGATLAWLSSELEVDGVIGYYGSRIRDYLEVEPNVPSLLFFAKEEKSVDVSGLEGQLNQKQNTVVKIVEAEHGFMNPFYQAYHPEHHRDCIEMSIDFLRRIEEI